ncbi:MAG TPA: hypothetical protein PLX65_02535 [Accumulibacter sp.]|nr:hypothetical protein [Accumulibacter sp.]HNL14732.1 hypothetical protein [Accumulibacter sp.]
MSTITDSQLTADEAHSDRSGVDRACKRLPVKLRAFGDSSAGGSTSNQSSFQVD